MAKYGCEENFSYGKDDPDKGIYFFLWGQFMRHEKQLAEDLLVWAEEKQCRVEDCYEWNVKDQIDVELLTQDERAAFDFKMRFM